MPPDSLISQIREARPVAENLTFYACSIRQALPDDWSQGKTCLPHQREWTQYTMRYGVVASSIEQAEQWVIAFHSQSGLPTAEITDTETYDDGYRDSPGIVWHTLPEGESS